MRISPDTRLGFAFEQQFGGAARVRLAPYPSVAVASDTDADEPIQLVPPVTVTGRLRTPGEVAEYHLPLVKGRQVIISVESQSLNLPLAPLVRLIDPAGDVAAQVDDRTKSREAVMTHVAAQDGDYRLTVGEQFGHGGERYFYCLSVRLQEPDFELSASADSITVATEKPTEFELNISRRHAPDEPLGPITIEAVGLPPGVTAPGVVSEPEGPTASKVNLQFSTTGESFSGPIRIVGTASEPREVKRFARTPARLAACLETIWLTAVAK